MNEMNFEQRLAALKEETGRQSRELTEEFERQKSELFARGLSTVETNKLLAILQRDYQQNMTAVVQKLHEGTQGLLSEPEEPKSKGASSPERK